MNISRYNEIMHTSDIQMQGDAPGSAREPLKNLITSALSTMSLNTNYLKAAVRVEFDKMKMGAKIYRAGWEDELNSWSLSSAAKVVAITAVLGSNLMTP